MNRFRKALRKVIVYFAQRFRNMSVKTVAYHALQPGTTLAILGAVHGNERCGTEAIQRLIQELDQGYIALKRGKLLLMPIANPAAYEQGVRYVERNLNRSLYPKSTKVHYEDYLDPILCAFLDQADVLLDLHSYSSQGDAFIFLDGSNPKEVEFAAALGVQDFVYGWTEAFGNKHDKEAQGTTEYAELQGAIAVTLECGHHTDTHASEVGYQAILKSLIHFDMLDEGCPAALSIKTSIKETLSNHRCVKMQSVYYREENARLAKPWRHFDFVSKNEPIAYFENDNVLLAPENGYIVLPKLNASVGDEWFYFGIDAQLPHSHRLVEKHVSKILSYVHLPQNTELAL